MYRIKSTINMYLNHTLWLTWNLQILPWFCWMSRDSVRCLQACFCKFSPWFCKNGKHKNAQEISWRNLLSNGVFLPSFVFATHDRLSECVASQVVVEPNLNFDSFVHNSRVLNETNPHSSSFGVEGSCHIRNVGFHLRIVWIMNRPCSCWYSTCHNYVLFGWLTLL